MKHLFIINPAAGKRESTAQLERRLAELTFDHEVVYTEKTGDARPPKPCWSQAVIEVK